LLQIGGIRFDTLSLSDDLRENILPYVPVPEKTTMSRKKYFIINQQFPLNE
jgi:hypothetical protein